ncbi:MAG TPA: hypothetical protein VEO91_03715 [Candidatus Limnocylindria bacterium]|nr:hypothetical protein [Candidatus Limnocylindria bacterium]
MSDDLEKAGDIAGDTGVYAAEAALGLATGGLSVIAEKVLKDNGVDIHEMATEGYKLMGEAGGSAAFDATSEETHQAALEHYENAGTEWDQGNYGSAVVEGVESVGTIVGGLAESAWDAITD